MGGHSLVLVRDVRTQTDAAYLAERLKSFDKAPVITGVPTGIEGTIHSAGVEGSVGFDSACHRYAQLVGNTGTDAAGARKYYHSLGSFSLSVFLMPGVLKHFCNSLGHHF